MTDNSPVETTSSNSITAPGLVRAISATFTGGAAHIPNQNEDAEANENTPIRNQSRRQAVRSQAELQQRVMEEVTSWMTDRLGLIMLFGLFAVVLLVVSLVYFVLAAIAVVNNHQIPCDQPLKWYVLVGIIWSQVPENLLACLANCLRIEDPMHKILLTFACSIPGWFLIGWGVYMISEAKTCPKTNPGLFFPTKRYIIVQIVMTVFTTAIMLFFALGFRRLLVLVNALMESPGCEAAVHKLPKVEPSAPELTDADGEVKSCIICLEELSEKAALKRSVSVLSAPASAIVKTPCSHYFHEDCLATWCKNHIDCPLCREEVGDADTKDIEAGAAV